MATGDMSGQGRLANRGKGPLLGIIADDLTGAMDSGLQFSKRGAETVVVLSWPPAPPAQAVVLDTDSRHRGSEEAARRAERAARALTGRALFKKIDSTMRGNLGAELRALDKMRRPRAFVVAPAFPAGGRQVRDGILYVDGRPLAETFFAHDPRWPMRESYLPTLLAEQWGASVGHVALDVVGGGALALAAHLRTMSQRLIVVDAASAAHLLVIAQALLRLGANWIPCGSAGLAQAWGQCILPYLPLPTPGSRADRGPALVVAGSRNDVTREQLRMLEQERGVSRVDYDPTKRRADVAPELAAACCAALERGADVALTTCFAPLAEGLGRQVAQVLAEATYRIVGRCPPGGLLLTGGDIALAICRALATQALRVQAEVQPGVPGGELVGGVLDGCRVITKAGGFGDARTLIDALAYLHGETIP